jgi:ubiquinone/menaquinone biosynthesis C-methylase UbiE
MFLNPRQIVNQFGILPGMKVADFGAGSGHFTIALARLVGAAGRVYAVDIQQNLLERIKAEAMAARLHNVELVWGNVEQIGGTKIKDESVDAVVISNLLFQIERKDILAEEAKRIVKRGGRVFVIDWSDSFNNLGPAPGMVVTESAAREIFQRAGFTLAESFPAGDHHYGFACRKNK